MLRELAATGQPVKPQRLATVSGVPLERTLALLREGPSEWDPSGERLVGFGLTTNPTPHRDETQGHAMYVWCAVDALAYPMLIGAPALIQSPCVATSDPIHMDLTPTSVERVEPADAVVSFLLPDADFEGVRQAACNRNWKHFIALRGAVAWCNGWERRRS